MLFLQATSLKLLTPICPSSGRTNASVCRSRNARSINTPKTGGSVSSKAVTGGKKTVPITKESTEGWEKSRDGGGGGVGKKKMNYAKNRKCRSRWKLRGIVPAS